MGEFKLRSTFDGIVRTKDSAFIPNDPKNADWIDFQEWEKGGGVPDPEFTREELDQREKDRAAAEIEGKIKAEAEAVARAEAIVNLKSRGEIPPDTR